jgi:hypothetical protein
MILKMCSQVNSNCTGHVELRLAFNTHFVQTYTMQNYYGLPYQNLIDRRCYLNPILSQISPVLIIETKMSCRQLLSKSSNYFILLCFTRVESRKTATATEVLVKGNIYCSIYFRHLQSLEIKASNLFDTIRLDTSTNVNQVHLYAVLCMKCSRYNLKYHCFESTIGIFISTCCYSAPRTTRNTTPPTRYIILRIPFYPTLCTREGDNSVVGGVRT